MKRFSLLMLTLMLVFTACGGKTVDIRPLLFQEGDLPAGFTGSEVSDAEIKHDEGAPDPNQVVSQDISNQAGAKGHVTVSLYKSSSIAAQAYDQKSTGFGTSEGEETQENFVTMVVEMPENIGEQAITGDIEGEISGVGIRSVDLMFQRCRALIYISLYEAPFTISIYPTTISYSFAKEDVVIYAGKLDSRLKEVVCP